LGDEDPACSLESFVRPEAAMPDSQQLSRKQLAGFLTKFTPEIAALAEDILTRMRVRYPTALELVYDNYNALAIGFGPTERASESIFSIALFPRWSACFFCRPGD
jgi:hypothetical protein